MELFTTSLAAAITEKGFEAATLQESMSRFIELSNMTLEKSSTAELYLNEKSLENLNHILDQDKYKKLAEYRELCETNPEAARALSNDIHVKGQLGEGLMEAQLTPYGEVRTQIPVQLDGAATSNKIDIQLVESNSSLKQTELTISDDNIHAINNYDVVKGDTASFEVKNGGTSYLKQELANGDLQQQIAAGKSISDHSFVVINQDTASAILAKPETGSKIISDIQAAGGRLIVGLPEQAVQSAIFLT